MSEVTVVKQVNEVTITKSDFGLDIAAPGPQGPPGPPGPAGGDVFTYTQSTPAATWIITHNLGRRVQVTILDASGNVVYSDVAHGSVNQTTITFATPVAGSAVIS